MKKRRKNQQQVNGDQQTLLTSFSAPYEYRQISTSRLISSQAYQRPVDPSHVQRIIKNFNQLYLDEIIVSYRDNKYFVVDGQNRIAALIQMNGGTNCMVACKVFYGLTYEQEAEMFAQLDSIKKRHASCDKIRAKAEAKTDPIIIAISDITAKYGIRWKPVGGASSGAKCTLRASKTLVDVYLEIGPHMFELVIRLLVRTWNGHRDSMNAAFILGLSLFVKSYVHIADEGVFVKKLSTLSPSEVHSLARSELNARTPALKYARVFLSRYNFRTSGKLPYNLE